MMLPVLHAGVEFFSLKDQLCLQEMERDKCPLLASIMISPFGELDILYDGSSEVFREILNIPELIPELIMKNSHVKRVYNALIHNTSQETEKAVIHHDVKKYILKLLIRKGNDNPISLGSIVISLVEDVSQYNYSDFFHRYGLTKRESNVVELITRGYSNRQISTCCHIAETTVKRHVSNILEKTSARSRFELISTLGLTSGSLDPPRDVTFLVE